MDRFLGNQKLFDLPKTAFLSSRQIEPAAVMRCYDWAGEMRAAGRCVISGFHSPLEKDVLRFLLKGTQPVVLVLARELYRKVPAELAAPLAEGRLLIVAPEGVHGRRAGVDTALVRNRWILAHAEDCVLGNIAPGGNLERALQEFPQMRITDLSKQ